METEKRILFLMSRVQHAVTRHLKKRLEAERIGISPAQMGILFLLKSENGQSMTALSRSLFIDNSTITGLIDRLEKNGLVTRERDPGDRRSHRIEITGEGISEINRAKTVVREVNERLTGCASEEEMIAFTNVLMNILAAIE
ncbi:MAG: MarR family transcriptional regulator [Spirochaetes bacterium]|nr:MarR family transcriptional regulator [Spirochaetota bacterium]